MTESKRASVFEDDDLDLSGFAPKHPDKPPVQTDQVRAVSEAAQFTSREPKTRAAPPIANKREPRRYRTGRNVQLNIKARAEAIETFYKIADQQRWVLGEAFERAVEALKRQFGSGQ